MNHGLLHLKGSTFPIVEFFGQSAEAVHKRKNIYAVVWVVHPTKLNYIEQVFFKIISADEARIDKCSLVGHNPTLHRLCVFFFIEWKH